MANPKKTFASGARVAVHSDSDQPSSVIHP